MRFDMNMRRDKQQTAEQTDRLSQHWEDATTPVADLEPGLAGLTDALRGLTRDEEPLPDFAAQLRSRIGEQATLPSRRHLPPRPRVWAGAGALGLALLVVGLFVVLQPGSETRVASAAEVLLRAQVATESAQAAGIESLAVTQTAVTYYLLPELGKIPSSRTEYQFWYQGPDRQRLQTDYARLSLDGASLSESSSTFVWDGEEYWTFDARQNEVHWLRQDPNADIYYQGVWRGAAPGALTNLYGSNCRDAWLAGEAQVAGRRADIVELSRPTCGMALPGADGRVVVWVDKQTGFVLKIEQYTAAGHLYISREVTAIDINTPIDESLLAFAPPPGANVVDYRDQPLGIGFASPIGQPPSITVEEAKAEATFPVRVPKVVPQGFELESVEHYWAGEDAKALRSHADWVLLRYANSHGDWLLIAQGYGGTWIAARHLSSPQPPEQYMGTIDVNGVPVQWVDGLGFEDQWQPGVMASMGWQAGRFGDGWEITPAGETNYGSPLYVGLASNVLGVEELAGVAASLE
jgi:outer membrane lipoprotein-sorting protein